METIDEILDGRQAQENPWSDYLDDKVKNELKREICNALLNAPNFGESMKTPKGAEKFIKRFFGQEEL